MAKVRGLVLGKFLPYHAGHSFLINEARPHVDELVVLVCTISAEPIDGPLRYEWVRRAHPDCLVTHVDEEVPQAPEQDPRFWEIWTDLIARHAGKVDVVFTSEKYGDELAERIGARHHCVDLNRISFPVSGTAVRTDPRSNWNFLSAPVRSYFTRRVAIVGPESTGKTTLAQRLARDLECLWVPEYGREYSEGRDPMTFNHDDFAKIGLGQTLTEDIAAAESNGLLICDTEIHTTCTWSELVLGDCREQLRQAAAARSYDLFLLLKPDILWVNDGTRVLKDKRLEHFWLLERELLRTNRRYRTIDGDGEERVIAALQAIRQLFKSKGA